MTASWSPFIQLSRNKFATSTLYSTIATPSNFITCTYAPYSSWFIEYQIWVSSTTDVEISFIKTTRNFAASCTFANSAQRRQFTVFRKMTELDVLSVNHTLESIVTYRKFVTLLRIDDTSVHLYICTCFRKLALARLKYSLNHLMPNDNYSGRTVPLTSKCCILYIYSTNIGTEYFKHGIYSPFFSLQNAVCFISLTYLVPVLFAFYIQGVLQLKKIITATKG